MFSPCLHRANSAMKNLHQQIDHYKGERWGCVPGWLSVEYGTLDIGVVSLSSTLGVEFTLKRGAR